jgi:hypothetical protein
MSEGVRHCMSYAPEARKAGKGIARRDISPDQSGEAWCVVSPLGEEWGMGFLSGFPLHGIRSRRLIGSGLRGLPLCAYSVGLAMVG